MSLFRPMNVQCPKCDAIVNMSAVGSVNADRRADLRAAILADTFQDTTCEACGNVCRLPPEFNYLDVGRGQWLASLSADRLPDFLEAEDEAQAAFDASYGKNASPAAREIGEGLAARVTFGWPALREKLLIREQGLDDVVVEMVKLELFRRLPDASLSPGVELRLLDGAGDLLVFGWVESDFEEVRQELRVRRDLYDTIAADAEGWKGVRARLTDGPFVDIQKLVFGEGRPSA